MKAPPAGGVFFCASRSSHPPERKILLPRITNAVILHRLNWSDQFQQIAAFYATM
jgi:hypothetical protein